MSEKLTNKTILSQPICKHYSKHSTEMGSQRNMPIPEENREKVLIGFQKSGYFLTRKLIRQEKLFKEDSPDPDLLVGYV